jgi:hypothetical protein
MRILFELNHPAHIHFFKNVIHLLKTHNHSIAVVIKDKDINYKLIQELEIDSLFLLGKYDSFGEKLYSLFAGTMKLFKISLIFRPDLYIGWNPVYCGLISKLFRKPFLLFEDNEYNWEQMIFRVPFATKIFTTSIFPHKFGRRHHTYNSYEELSYCHPKWMKKDLQYLKKTFDIIKKKNNHLITLRLVSWGATHDFHHYGLNLNTIKKQNDFLQYLQKFGTVLLSIEGKGPILINDNRKIKIDSRYFLDFLAESDIYIGEGGTTAAEAAIFGIPTIYTSTLIRSYLLELSIKYRLIYFSVSIPDIKKKIEEIFERTTIKQIYSKRRDKMLQEKIDLNQFMLEEIEKFQF